MSQDFRPSLREDGTFDPDCLEQAGQRWVTAWLKGRLSGHDPYFPIDKRGDEAPSGLIVEILEDAGMIHPARGLIDQGILDLLNEARRLAPEIPPYLKPALEVSQRARLPLTSAWFTEELGSLAADEKAVEGRWGARLVKEILHGAILQSPGLPTAASHASWRAILRMPRYATLAWMGLAPAFAESLEYIEDWWQAPAPQRQAEIDQFIFTGLKTEGRQRVRDLLFDLSESWSADLHAAVDSALVKNGVAKVFFNDLVVPAPVFQGLPTDSAPHWSTYMSAMEGAARDRQKVLQEQREAA